MTDTQATDKVVAEKERVAVWKPREYRQYIHLASQVKKNIKALLNVQSDPQTAHDIWASIYQYMPNPDNILAIAGQTSIEFYDSMMDSDSYLTGLIGIRKDAVTGLPWTIVPVSDDPADEELAEWVDEQLRNIEEFEDDMEELLGAITTGYAVSEIMWAMKENRIVPVELLSRRPSRFVFGYDYELRLITKENWFGEEVPPNKFIVHRNRKRYENPYGISACRSVYWPWHFKHHGFQWWIIAAERNAVPTPHGKYPADWDNDQQDDLFEALLGFQNDNAIITAEGTELDFFQTKTDPQLNEKLRDACNEELAWGIIGSTHSTGTGSKGGGSYALAYEHGTVRQDILERDCRRLMSTINKQLVEPMIILNFGEQREYPRFKLEYEPPGDRELEMKITSEAVKIGMQVDEIDAAERTGVKLAEQESDAIKMPSPAGLFGSGNSQEEEEEEEKEEVPELRNKYWDWPLKMR